MVTQCLTPWETARLFSKVAAQFYILTSSVWELQFLYILIKTYLFYCCHPCKRSAFFYCTNTNLICISRWLMMLSIFSCPYWSSLYLLWRNICSDHFPIFKLSFLSFYYWVVRVLYNILDTSGEFEVIASCRNEYLGNILIPKCDKKWVTKKKKRNGWQQTGCGTVTGQKESWC